MKKVLSKSLQVDHIPFQDTCAKKNAGVDVSFSYASQNDCNIDFQFRYLTLRIFFMLSNKIEISH